MKRKINTRAMATVVAFVCVFVSSSPGFAQVKKVKFEDKFTFIEKIEFKGDVNLLHDTSVAGPSISIVPTEINFEFRGTFGKHWEYRYRNRMAQWASGTDFFKASDIAYLGFYAGDHLRFRAGTGGLNLGGFEYTQSPIDVFFTSQFIGGIPCFLPACDVDWITENDRFGFELSRSPIMYGKGKGYNFIWEGHHGPFETLWSINVFENEPGKYMEMINLGTQCTLGPVALQFDFLPRFHFDSPRDAFHDVTLIGRAIWSPIDWLRVSAYSAYDWNDTGNEYDHIVKNGTSLLNCSALMEFLPFKHEDFRLHALVTSRTGLLGYEPVKTFLFNFGVTLRLQHKHNPK